MWLACNLFLRIYGALPLACNVPQHGAEAPWLGGTVADGATHAGRGVRSICPGAKDITVRRTQKKVLMKHGPRTE